jgi:phospholipase C
MIAGLLNFSKPDTTMPALPVITPPIPTPCGLFELANEIDNESYDFYKMLISDLMEGWKTL